MTERRSSRRSSAFPRASGTRLRKHELRGRTITLQLRVAPFETRTRQRTLTEPTSDDLKIYETARALLREALAADRDAGRVSPVRLVGVTASGLVGGEQLDLFTGARVSRLNAALGRGAREVRR